MQRMSRTVEYADSAGVQIAYEVVGEGERDVILIYEWGTSLDGMRDRPELAWFRNTLSEVGRVIQFDLRGAGLSDRVDRLPPLEEWVDDVRAVMSAVGSDSATLVGHGHAAQLCLLFAAMYPDRTDALITINGFARLARDADYPFGYPPKQRAQMLEGIRAEWGTGSVIAFTCPTIAAQPGGMDLLARHERAAGTPNRAVRIQSDVFALDVREVLASITSPTFVLHFADDPYAVTDHGHYLADHIRGAQYLECPGADHGFFAKERTVEDDVWVRQILGFLETPMPVGPPTRSLMTVAFTDIVDSTRTAAELGDAQWRRLLEKHEALARRHVERASGRVVKFTGDGMMATFDGPARAIECLRDLGRRMDEVGMPIRSGVHTGEVELLGDDIGGLGVHIAARVSAKASAREILVSGTVRDLVAGSGLEFRDQGHQELKGVPGTWQLLSVK
jgi:class 3 adenylate cyclase